MLRIVTNWDAGTLEIKTKIGWNRTLRVHNVTFKGRLG